MATERNGAVQMIPVLNDPSKQIAVPTSYRDGFLAQYGIELSHLVGDTPIHAVFVKEGLAFGIVHLEGGTTPRFVMHGVDLRPNEDANIEAVGSEVYAIWKSFPLGKLLSYDQLQKNWRKMFKKAAEVS